MTDDLSDLAAEPDDDPGDIDAPEDTGACPPQDDPWGITDD